MRPDRTTSLAVRFPLLIWSEEDNLILPPDDSRGVAFYVDPPNQPGLHRDHFKTWARRIAAELVMQGFPMSEAVLSHLPREYQSDSGSDAPPATPRSVSPSILEDSDSVDSSDIEGAHRAASPEPDSSDMEGAHRASSPEPDSSDMEGAHL